MITEQQKDELRKLFSSDNPVVNWAREEIEVRISELLDLSRLDMTENITSEEIGLEAKARKLAAEKAREIFTDLGFDLSAQPAQDRKKSWR